MEYKPVFYVGPTGHNPELGNCVQNTKKNIPSHLYEKYKAMGYIREPVKKTKQSTLKREA